LPEDIGIIVDPWNGAGSTTSVATSLGVRSYGFDLNPAAVVIAKARLLRSDVQGSIAPLTAEIIAAAARSADQPRADDPLRGWFNPSTAGALRRIERQIYRLLVSSDDEKRILDRGSLAEVSSLSTLFYLGLFRTVRPLVEEFIGSNPAWIRRRVPKSERRVVSFTDLSKRYQAAMEALASAVARSTSYVGPCPASVHVSSSTSLPLADNFADAALTSPPYCTRIDYVIATLPELAALGVREHEIRDLRDRMIGTPTIVNESRTSKAPLGRRASRLLREVARHDSRAAGTYYAPFYRQYLRGMSASLGEIERVTKSGAPAIIVAQDSYFKDIRVDVPSLIVDMARGRGWKLLKRHAFPVAFNRATMNPGRAYRTTSRATEEVLILATA
jgi:DNA modification methylase